MRSYKYLAAAVVALGMIAWLGPQLAWAEDMGGAGIHKDQGIHAADGDLSKHDMKHGKLVVGQLSFPAGVQVKDLDEGADIRNALKVVTVQALDDGEYDDVVNRLVDADRDRIDRFELTDADADRLDKRIDEFHRAWDAKYNQSFRIDENELYANVPILQGEISDPQQLVGRWPVPVTDKMVAGQFNVQDQAQPAAGQLTDKQQGKLEESRELFGGDVNLDKGRNVALVELPAAQNLPKLTLSLIHELPDIWRFDIPDNIDGQQLYNNVYKHVDYLVQHQNEWPADPDQARLMVTHHILMGVYGVDNLGAGGMGGNQQLQQQPMDLNTQTR